MIGKCSSHNLTERSDHYGHICFVGIDQLSVIVKTYALRTDHQSTIRVIATENFRIGNMAGRHQ